MWKDQHKTKERANMIVSILHDRKWRFPKMFADLVSNEREMKKRRNYFTL